MPEKLISSFLVVASLIDATEIEEELLQDDPEDYETALAAIENNQIE